MKKEHKSRHKSNAEKRQWIEKQMTLNSVYRLSLVGMPSTKPGHQQEAPGRHTVERRFKHALREKNQGKRTKLNNLRAKGAFGKPRFTVVEVNPIALQMAA